MARKCATAPRRAHGRDKLFSRCHASFFIFLATHDGRVDYVELELITGPSASGVVGGALYRVCCITDGEWEQSGDTGCWNILEGRDGRGNCRIWQVWLPFWGLCNVCRNT